MPGTRPMTLRRGQIVIILFSVWVLAVILPNVRFAPGNWKALKQRMTDRPPSLEALLGIILVIAVILFGGLVLFLWKGRWKRRKGDDLYQIYREPIRVPWSVYVIIVLLFAALGGVVWWIRQPSKVPEQAVPSLHSLVPSENKPESSPPPPSTVLPGPKLPELEWVGYLLAIGLLVGGSWKVWRSLKDHPEGEEPDISNVGQIAAQAAWDLEKGAELSDVVLRCYRDMCNILRRKVSLRQDMTAREFAQYLQEAGVREVEVARLTFLFEQVRYGRYVAGPEERAEAIALLKAIENQYGKVADET